MLLIIGTIRIPPAMLVRARAAMQLMVLASRAEDGCLDYAYAEDVLEPEKSFLRALPRRITQKSIRELLEWR